MNKRFFIIVVCILGTLFIVGICLYFVLHKNNKDFDTFYENVNETDYVSSIKEDLDSPIQDMYNSSEYVINELMYELSLYGCTLEEFNLNNYAVDTGEVASYYIESDDKSKSYEVLLYHDNKEIKSYVINDITYYGGDGDEE